MKNRNRDSIENHSIADWKDVVNGQFDKSVALAILFILFALIVSPKHEVKPYEIQLKRIIGIDWQPEPEPVIPKPLFQKPNIDIIIDATIDTDSDEIPLIDSIPITVLDPAVDVELPRSIIQAKNKYYEDAPVTLKSVRPVYPQFYKNIKVEGIVTLEAELLADGTIGRIEVAHSVAPGEGGLDESAIQALRKWKFLPAKVNNNPVTIWIQLDFEFKLE